MKQIAYGRVRRKMEGGSKAKTFIDPTALLNRKESKKNEIFVYRL